MNLPQLFHHRAARRWVAWLLFFFIAVLVGSLADDRVQFLLGQTALLMARMLLFALPLGVLLAVLLVKTDLPARRWITTAIVACAFLPLVIHASAWEAGFGIEGIWRLAGYPAPRIAGPWGAAWVHAMAAVPWITAIVALGLLRVEAELEEEATLNAPPIVVLCLVTLPRAAPAILAAAVWTGAMAGTEITVTNLFQVRTIAEEVYTGIVAGNWTGGVPLDAAQGGVFVALLAALALIGCWRLTQTLPTRHQTPWRLRLGNKRWLAFSLAVAVLLLIAGAPLLQLIYKAGVQVSQTTDGRVRNWSAAHCLAMVVQSSADHRPELNWSLLIACSAATMAMLLAAPLAWFARRGGWRAALAVGIIALALAVPGPILGLLLIDLFNQPDAPWLLALYDRSILAPTVAQAIKALPLAILILVYAFSTIPRALLETAALDGAGQWRRFWHVGLMARRGAVAGAWLAAATIAWGELAATILVTPPGISTLPIRVFGLLHYGVQDQVAAVCLLIIVGIVLLAAILLWLLQQTTTGVRRIPGDQVQ